MTAPPEVAAIELVITRPSQLQTTQGAGTTPLQNWQFGSGATLGIALRLRERLITSPMGPDAVFAYALCGSGQVARQVLLSEGGEAFTMNFAIPGNNGFTPVASVERDDPYKGADTTVDAYFSADVETDGPIPGPYSILSFALVYAGSFDGHTFLRPDTHNQSFYRELSPISDNFQPEALRVNGLDRSRLLEHGTPPRIAMSEANEWVRRLAGGARPVLVAYPLSFDWAWLYWYFVQFAEQGSPFGYSRCFDIKTAIAVKAKVPISEAGRSRLPPNLVSNRAHTHNALDDAIEQAEVFANLFQWDGR